MGKHAPNLDEIRPMLWTSDVTVQSYANDVDKYHAAILEQYKLYVEMADRVSGRRNAANAFFLTLNTAIFAVVGFIWQQRPQASAWWAAFPLVLVLTQCVAWYRLVKSYRQLNSAKWAVVGALEERLPASPYWAAEWRALGEGNDPRRYRPVTNLELWIPLLFGATYVGGFIAMLMTR